MKKYVHASTQVWSDLKTQLEEDCEYGDPFYEQTSAAETVFHNYQQPVEKELGIWLEPSVQGGQGAIWIYSSEDDKLLAEGISFEGFNDHCLDLVFSSSSPEEFMQQYKDYLKKLLDDAS